MPLRVISEDGARNALTWKYKGIDHSLLYYYIGSPMADKIVHLCIPRWMAPNMVTLLGLLFVIAGYFLAMYYNSGLTEEAVPSWVAFVCGVFILLYQLMDNMDGKQARRIGASSALGFLFDHGCDALNAGIMSPVTLAACLGAGGPDRLHYAVAMWFITVSTFFTNSWEEFHIGKFVLQIVNGPNEGIVVVVMVFFIAGIYSPHVWWSWELWRQSGLPVLFELDSASLLPIDYVILFALGAVPLTVLSQLFTALHHVHKEGTPRGADNAGFPVGVAALLRLTPIVVMCGGNIATYVYCKEVFLENPYTVFALHGSIFAELTSQLMISHVAAAPYRPFPHALLLAIVTPLAAVLLPTSIATPFFLQTLLRLAAAASVIHTIVYFSLAIEDLADTLNVHLLTLGKRREHEDGLVEKMTSKQQQKKKKSVKPQTSASSNNSNGPAETPTPSSRSPTPKARRRRSSRAK